MTTLASLAVPHAASRRVLLIQTQTEAAGAQEVSRMLAAELGRRGYDVHQLFFFRRTAVFDDDPRAVICAPTQPSGPLGLLRLLARTWMQIRRLRPDVVITFQHFGNLIGAPLARLAGIRHVIANHNGAQDLLAPWVVTMDRWIGMAGFYSKLVVNSASTEKEYEAYPDRYNSLITRIDHGFQPKKSRLDRIQARHSFGLPEHAILLGSVARLAPKKHLDAAIRLLPGEPGWHLVLAGQGPAREGLAALAQRLGCADRLHFTGELSTTRVGDLLAALDVFVFPSLTETFGLAAVEAAGIGVPVVSNRLPVMEEVLASEDGPGALFVDVDDTAAFAASVRRVLDDPAFAAVLAARGGKLRDRYPVATMVDGYEALIRAC